MTTRTTQVRTHKNSKAIHIWGREHANCRERIEETGSTTLQLDSGGFLAELSPVIQAILDLKTFRVEQEILTWEIVEWRETGRLLFKANVVDMLEEEYSQEPSWGTAIAATHYAEDVDEVIDETSERMKRSVVDPILVMCTWRVFDRSRGVLQARYGIEFEEPEDGVTKVLDSVGAHGHERDRLKQLWIASRAWW